MIKWIQYYGVVSNYKNNKPVVLGKDELGKKDMSYNKQYILIAIVCIILLLVTGCAEFQTKIDMMKSEQLTCKPPEVSLCAGWKV